MLHSPHRESFQQPEKTRNQPETNVKAYDLWFPNDQGLIEKAYPKPEEAEAIKRIKQRFQEAQTIIVPAGTWGLGDCIMELRYIHHLAEKTGKQVVVQVNPALMTVIEKMGPRLTRVAYTTKVNGALLADSRTFILSFRQSGAIRNNADWATPLAREPYSKIIESATQQDRLMEPNLFSRSSNHWHTRIEGLRPPENAQLAEAMYASQLKMLGVSITPEDIRQKSLISLRKETINRIPQDIDYFFIPDAKELEVRSAVPKRSKKSLSLEQWEAIMAKIPKNASVAIVRGVSHPDYCNMVTELARRHGLKLKVISGPLDKLALQMMRAKTIFGMDSGTTHLAQEAVRAAKAAGRKITLRSVIGGTQEFLSSYAVAEQPSFMLQEPDGTLNQDLGNINSEDLQRLINYVVTGKEK